MFSKIIWFLVVVFILGLSACGTPGIDEVRKTTCFIYTDGLLDDLCAIEYLSDRYESAVILLQDPGGLAGNEYASDTVSNKKAFMDTVSGWFSVVTEYSDSEDLSNMDVYLLAPLTEFASLFEENSSLKSNHVLMMAGDSDGPNGAGLEWNATADEEAYRYVTENMTDLTQITAPECEAAYLQTGYPFSAAFLDEYVHQMESMNKNVCCYDLQAVSYMFEYQQ